MSEDFKKQHIVPKRYLDRFATKGEKGYIIGIRIQKTNKVSLFTNATCNVGYIDNFYDVSDKNEPKYWEHYLANQIDSLYGSDMENIIATITLSCNDIVVLSNANKEVLARVMVAQMMRIPDSVDYVKKIYERVSKKVKNEVLSILPSILVEKYGERIMKTEMSPQWQKEQFFNYTFAPENFQKYCDILKKRIWVVYINPYQSEIPFVTSDNPVLVEGIGKSKIGLFYNGLASPTTCIFYPLTPTIAVANYARDGIFGLLANELDGKKIVLDDKKYIMDKNIKIIEQAYHHSFIPQPLFDEIVGHGNNMI